MRRALVGDIRLTHVRVVSNCRLTDGNLFSIPICLDVSENSIQQLGIQPGTRYALQDFRDDRNLAILTVQDVYRPDKCVVRPLSPPPPG